LKIYFDGLVFLGPNAVITNNCNGRLATLIKITVLIASQQIIKLTPRNTDNLFFENANVANKENKLLISRSYIERQRER
jgi:hypothetical protein